MNSEEAVAIAKKVAAEQNWDWREPIAAVKRRKWVIFGSVYWEVVSNAESMGSNVRILISDTTKDVLEKYYLKR